MTSRSVISLPFADVMKRKGPNLDRHTHTHRAQTRVRKTAGKNSGAGFYVKALHIHRNTEGSSRLKHVRNYNATLLEVIGARSRSCTLHVKIKRIII